MFRIIHNERVEIPMKLSFTTLGCPTWDLDTIIARAVEYGYQGVDFRGLNGEMNVYLLPEFSEKADETRRRFADAGLEISCFSSSVKAFSKNDLPKNIEEISAYARLCEIFGTPYIRVFGGGIGDTPREQAIEQMAANLNELARIVKGKGIKLLVETHDSWTDARHMRAVMDRTDPETVGVLWDTHHPYRMIGEAPADTWALLGPRIAYTHWKDSRKNPQAKNGFEYCLAGQGEIPMVEFYRLLKQNGYSGYFTVEWEKKWHPALPEPEVAFPQYAEYLRRLESVGQ